MRNLFIATSLPQPTLKDLEGLTLAVEGLFKKLDQAEAVFLEDVAKGRRKDVQILGEGQK